MAQNLVRVIRNLQRRNARRRLDLAVAEGVRLVEEAVAAEVRFEGVVVGPGLTRTDRGSALARVLEERGVARETVSDEDLVDLADTDRPQGILAVIEPPSWSDDDLAPAPGRPVLVLDAVQDPGNLGALLRTALALSGAGVILLSGNAHPNHPKVLRGAMGATFRLPVVPMDAERLPSWLERRGVRLWVAEARGKDIRDLDCSGRLALVIGSEGSGIRRELLGAASETVSVSISPQVESLNVAVAAGILLHEIVRDA